MFVALASTRCCLLYSASDETGRKDMLHSGCDVGLDVIVPWLRLGSLEQLLGAKSYVICCSDGDLPVNISERSSAFAESICIFHLCDGFVGISGVGQVSLSTN